MGFQHAVQYFDGRAARRRDRGSSASGTRAWPGCAPTRSSRLARPASSRSACTWAATAWRRSLSPGLEFLGAGVILHEGPTIRGLNTAATLWCAAAVGALAGTGLRVEADLCGDPASCCSNLGLRRMQMAINQRGQHPIEVETDYSIEIACDPTNEDGVYQQLFARPVLPLAGTEGGASGNSAVGAGGIPAYGRLGGTHPGRCRGSAAWFKRSGLIPGVIRFAGALRRVARMQDRHWEAGRPADPLTKLPR